MLRGCRMLLAGLVVLGVTSGSDAEGDWSMSNLVPSKKTSTTEQALASVSDAGPQTGLTNMSLPTWSKKKGTPTMTSGWNKFKRGTQDLMHKTKDALTPGGKKPHGRVPRKPAATWYKPWTWISHTEEPRIDSVDDFLPLPRPGI